jgi:hypothetical protein
MRVEGTATAIPMHGIFGGPSTSLPCIGTHRPSFPIILRPAPLEYTHLSKNCDDPQFILQSARGASYAEPAMVRACSSAAHREGDVGEARSPSRRLPHIAVDDPSLRSARSHTAEGLPSGYRKMYLLLDCWLCLYTLDLVPWHLGHSRRCSAHGGGGWRPGCARWASSLSAGSPRISSRARRRGLFPPKTLFQTPMVSGPRVTA